MADQPLVAEQRFELLVRHRDHARRLEALEDLLERRPPGVDQAVLEPRAEDPQRHQREIAVVAQAAELLGRLWLRQATHQRLHAADPLAGALLDRFERDHQAHGAPPSPLAPSAVPTDHRRDAGRPPQSWRESYLAELMSGAIRP